MTVPFSIPEGLRRWLPPRMRGSAESSAAVYEELLYLASKTQSLEELLTKFPERLCEALQLRSFRVFLRERNDYVLHKRAGSSEARVSLPASSSTVLRMKRDRRPALLVAENGSGPKDGWQMLATAPEMEALTQADAQVLVPLEGRMGLMGFATLSRGEKGPFSDGEIDFLRDLGPQMGRGLETAQLIHALSEEAAERVRVHRELELAREVQERLLPREVPHVAGLEVATCYRSVAQVGGDYYDVFPVADGVCVVIADISGKGISAALLMAALRASLHALAEGPGVAVTQLVERLNQLLYHGSSASRYATLFLSVYRSSTRELTYVNAGHNPPLLLQANGGVRRLTCGGAVVGLLPEVTYVSETVQLEEGDMLAAYTDGVTEAMNAQLEEWGEERFAQAVGGTDDARRGAQATVDRVLEGLNRFTEGWPQNDDLTLVVCQVTGDEANKVQFTR